LKLFGVVIVNGEFDEGLWLWRLSVDGVEEIVVTHLEEDFRVRVW
jgi:(2Fe-2S) ferredoxin